MNPQKSKLLMTLVIIFVLIFYVNTGMVQTQDNEITADEITLNTENGQQEIIAEGNACIIYSTLTFNGDTIYYNTDTDKLQLTGNITLIDEDYTVKGDRLDGNLEQGNFTIEGADEKVEITGPDLYATAGIIDYNQQEGRIVLQQNPVLTYKQLEASADKITYNLNERTAFLSGNVSGVQGDGREFSAREIDINLATEKIKMSGGANLIFKEDDASQSDKE